jgi:hypothetical protein
MASFGIRSHSTRVFQSSRRRFNAMASGAY